MVKFLSLGTTNNKHNMDTKEIKKTTVQITGIRVEINYKDVDESIRLWIQKIILGENPHHNFIFAKPRSDDNSILFYTEEGLMFYKKPLEYRLPAELFSDDLLVGVIYLDYPNENPECVRMTAKIVANPKGNDKQSAELVMFRAEMIQKFGYCMSNIV